MADVTYAPCAVCAHETGLAAKDSCEHTCLGCEGTRSELDGFPCLECGGTGLRGQWRTEELARISDAMRELLALGRRLIRRRNQMPNPDVQSRETLGEEMTGAELIAAERERQVSEEGWTAEHDDRHGNSSLAYAAACYAVPERIYVMHQRAVGPAFDDPWPWQDGDKRKYRSNFPNAIPTDGDERLRTLVKAGALIAAEIDRLKRAADAH